MTQFDWHNAVLVGMAIKHQFNSFNLTHVISDSILGFEKFPTTPI